MPAPGTGENDPKLETMSTPLDIMTVARPAEFRAMIDTYTVCPTPAASPTAVAVVSSPTLTNG